jgi:hypothetical protein
VQLLPGAGRHCSAGTAAGRRRARAVHHGGRPAVCWRRRWHARRRLSRRCGAARVWRCTLLGLSSCCTARCLPCCCAQLLAVVARVLGRVWGIHSLVLLSERLASLKQATYASVHVDRVALCSSSPAAEGCPRMPCLQPCAASCMMRPGSYCSDDWVWMHHAIDTIDALR